MTWPAPWFQPKTPPVTPKSNAWPRRVPSQSSVPSTPKVRTSSASQLSMAENDCV
jgi:hypothetical protein